MRFDADEGVRSMKHPVTISRNRYRSLLKAEQHSQAHRSFIGQRVCDQTQAQMNFLMKKLISWMDSAGKRKFEDPKGWPE